MTEKLLTDLARCYGLHTSGVAPMAGGWLNEKWKITTSEGDFLVKRYSPVRYRSAHLPQIEQALQRQRYLWKRGVLCPEVLLHGDTALRTLDNETSYTVMRFCPGWTETGASATPAQLRSLGDECGRMHAELARLPAHGVKGYPLAGQSLVDALRAHIRFCRTETEKTGAVDAYRQALNAVERILPLLERDEHFFARQPTGIAHEDFSGDNLLFFSDSLSAIVDFDRSQYSWLHHDIGRALLSLAWDDGQLSKPKIAAFTEGYAHHRPLTCAQLADVLRLTWCIEVPWWIQRKFFPTTEAKVARFQTEILWLTVHWDELETVANVK